MNKINAYERHNLIQV